MQIEVRYIHRALERVNKNIAKSSNKIQPKTKITLSIKNWMLKTRSPYHKARMYMNLDIAVKQSNTHLSKIAHLCFGFKSLYPQSRIYDSSASNQGPKY